MDVGAAGDHVDPRCARILLEQTLGQDLRAVEGALLALAELRLGGQLERHRLGRDDVLERAALLTGEHRGIELLGQRLVVGQDDAAARTAEGLVRRRGDHVRVRHGGGMQSGGDQAGEVRHVDHQVGADLVGDAAELGEVELPRIGRPAGQDQLRPVLPGQSLDLGHVDPVVVVAHVVGGDVVELAGEVQLHAVGEVAAVRQGQAQNRVARGQQRGHRRGVGLCAGMWLHVGVRRPEETGEPVDGQLLDDVDVLAAAVVAATRIALGVLVGQHRALCLHHRERREVLARDHLQRALLAEQLGCDRAVHLGIEVGQRLAQNRVGGRRCGQSCGVESHSRLPDIPVNLELIYQLWDRLRSERDHVNSPVKTGKERR